MSREYSKETINKCIEASKEIDSNLLEKAKEFISELSGATDDKIVAYYLDKITPEGISESCALDSLKNIGFDRISDYFFCEIHNDIRKSAKICGNCKALIREYFDSPVCPYLEFRPIYELCEACDRFD